MKTSPTIILVASLLGSASANKFSDAVKRITHREERAATDADAAEVVEGADEDHRQLSCWRASGSSAPEAQWHPVYSAGWSAGFCRFTVDCNSPGYSSHLACCKGAYMGQTSGHCLATLPSPPTMAPTESGGLDVYYPDYGRTWAEGMCINTRPLPSGRPTYSTMLSCCKGAYGGQMSGKCISQLPSPPTSSPTNSDYEVDFWYPQYEQSWSDATCSNKLPLPFNPGDRPTYSTMLSCCKGAYGGQMSGACLAALPSPPTMAPTDTGGYDFWYPDYGTPWSSATCKNERPLPFLPGGRPTYSTMIACCKGAYGGQTSGACLGSLPNPPTMTPTESGGLDVFYPDYDRNYGVGKCINDRPLPSGRPSYSTKQTCCTQAYGSQSSHFCMCDAVGVCYSCKCGTPADRATAGCTIDCGDDEEGS
mmetsp:Transcript_34030/g.71596  ORF Transcript_34030/g.71596 Transcript_34030/m.71596 type:complete len:421 (+) Transcript_34030:124-1386(+)